MRPAVKIRSTGPADLDYVLAAERGADNREFVLQWSEPQHRAVMCDIGSRHWIVEAGPTRERVGFLIVRRDGWKARSVELKRLVITQKRRGYGRGALRFVKRWAFEEVAAHRLWLDVFEGNHGARALYESEGFVVEGVRRDHVHHGGRFVSVVLMSMLEDEYWRQKNGGP